jgi:signal transduction histidine kinase
LKQNQKNNPQMKKVILLLITGFIFLFSFLPAAKAQEVWSTASYALTENKSLIAMDSTAKTWFDLSAQSPDSALIQMELLYHQAVGKGYYPGIVNILFYTGSILLTQKSEPQKALSYFERARQYQHKIAPKGQYEYRVRLNNCLGAAFIALDKYDSAMSYLVAALTLVSAQSKEANKPMALEIAKLYNNMSVVYSSFGQQDKSVFYLRKEETLAIQEQLDSRFVTTYLGLAYNYMGWKKFDSALVYLRKASLPQKDFTPLENIYVNLGYGSYYFKQGIIAKAIPYYKTALKLSEKNKPDLYAISLSNLAASYFLAGDYETSASYFQVAVDKKELLKTPDYVLVNIYNNLAILNDTLRNYKMAYQYRTLASQLKDSLNSVEKNRDINELETRYHSAENEKALTHKKLELLATENKLNKKSLLMRGVISVALFLFLLSLFFIQYQRLKLQRAGMQRQLEKNEQLKALIESEEKERNRIGHQLHDDVMVEFSIVKMNMAALTKSHPEIRQIKGYWEISKQLNLASIKLRQTAHNLMPGILTEEGLLSAINYFCSGVQRTSGLSIELQHYGNIPRLSVDTEISLYRMIQELVQNVIKHAKATKILIRLSYGDGDMNIMVEDNGKGIGNVTKALDGMGLKSIALRLQSVHGELEIKTAYPQGTSVQIDLKVQPA